MSEVTSETLIAEKIDDKVPQTIDELIAKLDYLGFTDIEIIRKAFEVSDQAHKGQIRRSGEPYISHPLGVASILADLHLDAATIATGLLHDTVEDTGLTLEEIEKEFGPEVSHLVDGVTKISRIRFRNTHEKQGENIRKMIVAMGKDIRVVLVKLADRLHNMRTLNHMPPHKQEAIALETIEIYAPLASRLGISSIKIELEDLSFRYLKPDKYYELAQKVAKKKKEREKYIEEVKRQIALELQKHKIKADVQGRPKHLYSIYKKMELSNLDYDNIYDVIAFRILVDNLAQCYEVLGIIHSVWKPIPGRFKDFIAMPKPNNYQSLHTTVIGPEGERMEVQIRTNEMHLVAERGIAAHWKYKEKREIDQMTEEKFRWLRDMVAGYQQTRDADEFLENFKTDLFEHEIYVFTPKGDVKALPEGATALDFAYSVHTDVGNQTVGAKVNGRMVPLKHRLKSGDTLEIMTSPSQHPSKDWLKFCVTSRALSKIRAFIRAEERKQAIELGREIFEKETRKLGISVGRITKEEAFDKFLKSRGYHDLEDLYANIGFDRVTTEQVIKEVMPEVKLQKDAPSEGFFDKILRSTIRPRAKKSDSIIEVSGLSDILVRFGKCCNPIPGDPIIGCISRGRGVTVHHASCPKAFDVDQGRRIDVSWTQQPNAAINRVVRIRVVSQNITGLLSSMTEVFRQNSIDVQGAKVRTTKDNLALSLFDVTVKNINQLSKVLQDLSKIKGVIEATRSGSHD